MHHIALKFSIYLESPSPGKLFSGNKKRAIPTSTKEGGCAGFLIKTQRSHRNEDKPGLLGPEVRIRKLSEMKGQP